MGVLGLTPFIQKTCPEVVRVLPDRLKSLKGKRIIIDGTLITQRFHFAPIPHPHRHVLCWYRLVRHLQSSDVQAVCVFDGRQRSAAKEREVERRRKDRMLTAARGVFEDDRLTRLRKLTKSLQAVQSHRGTRDDEHRVISLRDAMEKMKVRMDSIVPPSQAAAAAAETKEQETKRITTDDMSDRPPPRISQGLLHTLCLLLQNHITKLDDDHLPSDTTPQALIPSAASDDVEKLLRTGDTHKPPPSGRLSVPKNVAEDISRLYVEYQQSIPQLISLAAASSSAVTPISTGLTAEEVEEARVDYALSKSQHGLVVEEGKFWEQLTNPEALEETITSLAESLEAKSNVLAESYARRTHAPTTATYEESREVLRTMGIPCIEPSGPYEAEALAASIVLHGYADYVASEDTDVLVYDAPLIRNLASSTAPLVIISGADVRAVLQLDRGSFIDFALLLGTDFSQRIKNVGPARALKFIREYGSIERVLEHERQYPPRIPPAEYLQQVELARDVFQTLPPIPDPSLLQQGEIDEAAVWTLMDKYNLHRYVAEDWDHSQSLLGNYFADNPAAL
ncbi:PIN domain-like protein [Cubamyces sp. BRFM 1775]|nr:PIN domain-like protein [Cubamyces sp. BRFM 1775]